MKILNPIGHLIIILLLTAITQVGGLIWVLTCLFCFLLKKKKRFIFPMLYIICNVFIVPPIAKSLGREPLPVFSKELKPRNWMYPLLFRNYVNPILKTELKNSAKQLHKSGIKITYLDANFPFIKGFPLLPHLSHNDGKKIDIAFMYLDKSENPTDKKPSVSGYGIYINPKNNNTASDCLEKGYWQYDFTKYLTLGKINHLSLDKKNTTFLIKQLLLNKYTEKIFIEPHLKQTLGFQSESKIRFHGCKAVRHDDHIHLQIK